MNIGRISQVSQRQRGSVLVVAIILLLLASVITLLSLNVGLFEQRTSGNDSRAKLIAEVAEAGIAQGAEYFRLRPAALNPSSNWPTFSVSNVITLASSSRMIATTSTLPCCARIRFGGVRRMFIACSGSNRVGCDCQASFERMETTCRTVLLATDIDGFWVM